MLSYRNHKNTAFSLWSKLCQAFVIGRSDWSPSQSAMASGQMTLCATRGRAEASPAGVRWTGKPDMIAERTTPFQSFGVRAEDAAATGVKLESIGLHVTRYAIVLVLVWIGAMKFTAYEAGAIQPLVANSPLMSWLYAIFSVQATSNLIGVAEITAGVLIGLRPWSAMACVLGSLMAIGTFVITLTFLFSTPGWESSLGGFPALSVAPGQFILKDAVLLGAAIWSFGEALRHVGD